MRLLIATFLVVAAALTMAHLTVAAQSKVVTLFDFGSRSQLAGWQVVNDDVMGGRSNSSMKYGEDGSLVFTGNVSLENNGGFASIRSGSLNNDFSGHSIVSIRVKGDGKAYRFSVRPRNGSRVPSFQASFETKAGEWKIVDLPYESFVPSFRGWTLKNQPPLEITQNSIVGFTIGNKKAESFTLKVDWIRLR